MKTLFIKKKEVYLKVERYQNKTIYLQLYELDGEPWTTITLNPDIALPYGIAAIKNYSENEGMLKWLLDNSIIHAQVAEIQSGYIKIPVVSVNISTLEQLDPIGVEGYKQSHKVRSYERTPFELGQIVITSAAQAVLNAFEVGSALVRHINNDWGICERTTWDNNCEAVKTNGTLQSVYQSQSGIKFWIITEHDRSVTTILLPEDY